MLGLCHPPEYKVTISYHLHSLVDLLPNRLQLRVQGVQSATVLRVAIRQAFLLGVASAELKERIQQLVLEDGLVRAVVPFWFAREEDLVATALLSAFGRCA